MFGGMGQERLFLDKSRTSKMLRLLIPGGIGPVRLFADKFNAPNLTRLVSSPGISPERKLPDRSILVNSKLPKENKLTTKLVPRKIHMLHCRREVPKPVRLLPEKCTSFKSDGSADGNSPLRLFSERSSTVSEVMVWKVSGIEPWMSLFFRLRVARLLRSRVVTCPVLLSHSIPSHLQQSCSVIHEESRREGFVNPCLKLKKGIFFSFRAKDDVRTYCNRRKLLFSELGRTGEESVKVEMLSVAEDRKVARGNEKSYLLPLLPVSQLNGNEHKNLVGRAIKKPEIGISPGFGQQQASPEYPESWNESSPHANEERGCSV
nr:hypothetical protein RchiOBHm_Chr1g0344651 [Ipomoea batatas]